MTSSTGTDVSRETSVEPKDRPEHLARAVDAATMESELAAFKDPKLARGLIESIAKLSPAGGATLMEVCGTHTVAIARNGIRNLMPEGTRLASGPGCPVCVTSNKDIDTVIALARVPGVTIATFGDMTRVPGSTSSLLAEQAAGRSVQIVYSPLDALTLAQQNPDREIVFVGVGFETTTPLVAMAIKRAAAAGLKNFSVFGAHKNMPGALEAIINDPQLKVDALILPGHVSTIIGAEPYRFLAEKYGIPGVITGFEPVDVLQGIAMIMRQLHEGRADIEIAYARGVMPEGNPVALAAIDEVFETCTALWRGLGEIPGSGYRIREEFAQFDAVRRFQRQFSLSADGILGKDTWNKIVSVHNAMQAGNPTHVTTQYPGVPLRVGSTGDYVRFVQSYLNGISGRPLLTVDGNYGQNTTRAVGLFQATAGLPVDGVVGSATWAALIPAFNATL